MKSSFALALFVVFAFAAAGCGGAKKFAVVVQTTPVPGRTVEVLGSTATIAMVRTGTRITCKGWKGKGVKVPRRGEAVAIGQTESMIGKKPSGTEQMSLTHHANGSITVTCGPTHY